MKPIYLVRRKGFDDYMSCSKERFEELGQKDLFETKIAYEAPREWVDLTDDVIWSEWKDQSKPERSTRDFVLGFARAINAMLKEKNT